MSWTDFNAVLKGCEKCLLCHSRTQVVCGAGQTDARIMLLGEAPGGEEDLSGEPFVGAAGKNLERFLAVAGLKRTDVYIANTVKCRPVKDGKRGYVNRKPSSEEIRVCSEWLWQEIALLKPRLLVTLGAVPLALLTGVAPKMLLCHGKECAVLQQPFGELPVFALYHPAAIIYDRQKEGAFLEDMRLLANLISERKIM